MNYLPELFANNRKWAALQTSHDARYFERLCDLQRPEYLWIGCSDSRVPANTIVGLAPGEVFVHRNVANLVRADDRNCLTVLQYAVDVLRVSHIIVCGHYNCGGVQAALGPPLAEPLESWLSPIRTLCASHENALASAQDQGEKWRRLCEFNILAQVRILNSLPTVVQAWARGHKLVIHGWIYDLKDGLLRDLEVSAAGIPRQMGNPEYPR